MIASKLFLTLTGMLIASSAALADDNACMEGPMAEFGRYVGDWKIDDQTLAQDGSGWAPGKGARWIFKCVGEGTAVQDFWMPNGGGWGTNLRTYNPDTSAWEIAWAAKALNGLMHISARRDDNNNMNMDILSPDQNPPRRIRFYAPDNGGWNWVMEMSFDEGETWTAVYKIRATPWIDSQ